MMKFPNIKAPALIVSAMFAVVGIGGWLADSAAPVEALALLFALWKFLQVYEEGGDRCGKLARLLWG